MTASELQTWLQAHAEPQLAAFNKKLLPNCQRPIWGIRTPVLRKFAKELLQSKTSLPTMKNSHEEALLQAYLIGMSKTPFSELLRRIQCFLPEIDNWAICDSFCTVLTAFKRYESEGFHFLLPYCSSEQPFEQRFAVVMLLTHYIRSSYIERLLEIFTHIEPRNYYVKMAVGWALAACYVKYPERVEDALRHARIHPEVRQMAIQKILDSNHTDNQQRQRILRLKAL